MASSQSRRALLDNISCQSSSQRSSSPFRLFSAGRTIRASRRGTPQSPTMGRLSELRALFLFGGQPLPDQLWVGLEESGVVSWIVETAGWLSDPLRPSTSSIQAASLCLLAYSHQPIEIVALIQELQILRKRAVETASQSPGFYDSLFLIRKVSGSWHPIIDFSP